MENVLAYMQSAMTIFAASIPVLRALLQCRGGFNYLQNSKTSSHFGTGYKTALVVMRKWISVVKVVVMVM